MNNEQLLKNLPKLEEKKDRLAKTKLEFTRLQEAIDVFEEQIELLENVDEVYDGVAIEIWNTGTRDTTFSVRAIDEELTTRGAYVYQNANNKWSWGLNLVDDTFGRKGERWQGAHYPDLEEVMQYAKDWVVHGKEPKYQAPRPLEDVLCD